MKKYELSPNQNIGNDSPDTTPANNPNQGETANKQKRSRAPQFGSDRRNSRDMDSRRPKSARHHGDVNGPPQQSSDNGQRPERRVARQDRRHSYS